MRSDWHSCDKRACIMPKCRCNNAAAYVERGSLHTDDGKPQRESTMTNETDKIATALVTLAGYNWTADEIGAQLDRGMICAHMYGRVRTWYRARRNGKTQTWKTRPGHFRIPVKA